MCGLAGFLLRTNRQLAPEAMLERARKMIDILHHRGPDGHATWSEHTVALAHARLAIIDTSASANQPMHDSDNFIHVVFNGEIYNFRLIRRELETLGHRFRTHSDTEVIVNGYKQWGK